MSTDSLSEFGRTTLPFCSFVSAATGTPHVGVGIGTQVLDISEHAPTVLPTTVLLSDGELFVDGSLDALLAAGPAVWAAVREGLLAADLTVVPLLDAADLTYVPPYRVGDYVDFYASEQHATNVGQILRPSPDGVSLPAAWKHLPIGYHGRSGTVVVSGTPVVRPRGQQRSVDGDVTTGPSTRLDLEAEIGFVVGKGSVMGDSIGVGQFADHVFGVCVVNDWSARDLQAFEYVPLGPFLGKSFATSVSPWIVPLAALQEARVAGPPRTVVVQDYLDDTGDPWGLDLWLEVRVNGELISSPPFAGMYWTGAQMLAHMTVNGASVRPGDLFASGTVSGSGMAEQGSLIELSRDGQTPLSMADGTTRSYLLDGDRVTISAWASTAAGPRAWLGAVEGTITPHPADGSLPAL